MVVCAIWDKVAERANDPFIAPNIESAKRLVSLSLRNNSSLIVMASDLELLQLAFWSPERCELKPDTSISHICLLSELLPSVDEPSPTSGINA